VSIQPGVVYSDFQVFSRRASVVEGPGQALSTGNRQHAGEQREQSRSPNRAFYDSKAWKMSRRAHLFPSPTLRVRASRRHHLRPDSGQRPPRHPPIEFHQPLAHAAQYLAPQGEQRPPCHSTKTSHEMEADEHRTNPGAARPTRPADPMQDDRRRPSRSTGTQPTHAPVTYASAANTNAASDDARPPEAAQSKDRTTRQATTGNMSSTSNSVREGGSRLQVVTSQDRRLAQFEEHRNSRDPK
jgi:hypothetical protein